MQKIIPPLIKRKTEHGGAFSIGRRRSLRPLTTKKSLHVTLRSQYAKGERCLLKHQAMIEAKLFSAAKKFRIRVYEVAVCGNHLHLSIRGKRRIDIQNFFRVFAGHVAQAILRDFPIPKSQLKKQSGCKKNQRKFWEQLLYSRVVSWGNDFKNVQNYIIRNTLEALGIIPYKERKTAYEFWQYNTC